MKMEYSDILYKKFPQLYAHERFWGFECGDGWFPLIEGLSTKICGVILQYPREERKYYYVEQVKEKFGTLRFYMSTTTSDLDDLIYDAERASSLICEVCSAPGTVRSGTWLSCLCEECYKQD